MVLIIGTLIFISPQELTPNSIVYEKEDLKVSFYDALSTKIGDIELKSHPSVDYIKPVSGSYAITTWYDFNFINDISDGIGDIKFINMRDNKTVNREYSLVYWGVETDFKNGTQIYNWLDYNSRDIPNEVKTIGIKTKLEKNDWIDAVWTVKDFEITKHAQYIAIVNITHDSGWSIDSSNGGRCDGIQIMPNLDFYMINVTKPSSSTATTVVVQYQNLTNITTATYSGDVATFGVQRWFETGTKYLVRNYANGGAYDQTYKTYTYPGPADTTWLRVDNRSYSSDNGCFNTTNSQLGYITEIIDIGLSNTSNVSVSKVLTINITTANQTIFTTNPLYLSGVVGVGNLTITNVSLILNGSINQTNSSTIEGVYNFSLSPADGIYYWDFEAYDNESNRYTSENGTFQFNKTTPPITAPNQTLTIPNFNLSYESNLNISWNTYFTGIDNASQGGFVNISFIDYNPPIIQTLLPTYLSPNSNISNNYLGDYFQISTSREYISIQSYSENRTVNITAKACNDGGCINSNNFLVNISKGIEQQGGFLRKGSNWFLKIIPSGENLSFLAKFGIMFVVLLFITVVGYIGTSAASIEAPNNSYIVGIINLIFIAMFVSLGYISIWVVGLIFIIILSLYLLMRYKNG